MKQLNHKEVCLIAGGNELIITRQVDIRGISDICVRMLLNGLPTDNMAPAIKNERLSRILAHCSKADLDLLSDRLDEALIQTISFS